MYDMIPGITYLTKARSAYSRFRQFMCNKRPLKTLNIQYLLNVDDVGSGLFLRSPPLDHKVRCSSWVVPPDGRDEGKQEVEWGQVGPSIGREMVRCRTQIVFHTATDRLSTM